MGNNITFANIKYIQEKLKKICSCKNSPLLMPDAKKVGKYLLFNANDYIGKCDFGEEREYISIIKYGSGIGKVKIRPSFSNVIGTMGIINEKDSDLKFLYYLLQATDFSKYIEVGTAPNMYFEDFGEKEISVPNIIDDQKKIGDFLFDIEKLINDKRTELKKTKQYKASMLSKMFPKEGSLVPEIRFKEFDGEWTQVCLKRIAKYSKGLGYSKSDLTKSGKEIFLYGRMYTKYTSSVKDIDTFTNKIIDNVRLSTGKEVVFPASGETAEDISRATAILKPGIILGGDLNIIQPNDDFDPTFLALMITYTNFHFELSKKAQGKTVVHIHNEDTEDIPFLYPKKEEQEKIVSFFTHLDDMISNQEKEIETLEHFKKTLLNKMFA